MYEKSFLISIRLTDETRTGVAVAIALENTARMIERQYGDSDLRRAFPSAGTVIGPEDSTVGSWRIE